MSDLNRQKILVAGASSGMGREVAKLAAEKGASLILLGRNAARLTAVEREVIDLGAGGAISIPADAGDAASLRKILEPYYNELKSLDALINTIGFNIPDRSFLELTDHSWSGMVDANLNAAFNLAKIAIPIFRERSKGLIINVSSIAAKRPDVSGAAYQATKAAVVAMTHAIQEEEWQNGIRATAIMPGLTDTPLLNKRPNPPTAEMRARALQPEDVARACLFVAELPARAHISEMIIEPSMR